MWIQITSGNGPDECALAVSKITQRIIDEAKSYEIVVETLEVEDGDKKNTYKSVILEVKGPQVMKFLSNWQGTIQWICQSPYRPNHRRKNWFIGVNFIDPLIFDEFNQDDILFQTMRAKGAGGQHVNTTDSAVRAIHKPSGITVVIQGERSQHMNKRLAISKIEQRLKEITQNKQQQKDNEKWQNHSLLERGNPIRIFTGVNFKEKKV